MKYLLPLRWMIEWLINVNCEAHHIHTCYTRERATKVDDEAARRPPRMMRSWWACGEVNFSYFYPSHFPIPHMCKRQKEKNITFSLRRAHKVHLRVTELFAWLTYSQAYLQAYLHFKFSTFACFWWWWRFSPMIVLKCFQLAARRHEQMKERGRAYQGYSMCQVLMRLAFWIIRIKCAWTLNLDILSRSERIERHSNVKWKRKKYRKYEEEKRSKRVLQVGNFIFPFPSTWHHSPIIIVNISFFCCESGCFKFRELNILLTAEPRSVWIDEFPVGIFCCAQSTVQCRWRGLSENNLIYETTSRIARFIRWKFSTSCTRCTLCVCRASLTIQANYRAFSNRINFFIMVLISTIIKKFWICPSFLMPHIYNNNMPPATIWA